MLSAEFRSDHDLGFDVAGRSELVRLYSPCADPRYLDFSQDSAGMRSSKVFDKVTTPSHLALI